MGLRRQRDGEIKTRVFEIGEIVRPVLAKLDADFIEDRCNERVGLPGPTPAEAT